MDNLVTLAELGKALDDLITQDAPPPLEETDITIRMVKERAGCGDVKAANLLNEWVRAGKVEYAGERRGPKGHAIKAWRLKA